MGRETLSILHLPVLMAAYAVCGALAVLFPAAALAAGPAAGEAGATASGAFPVLAMVLVVLVALAAGAYVFFMLWRPLQLRLSRTEEELTRHASQALRLRAIIDSSPDICLYWDPAEGREFLSPGAAKTFAAPGDAGLSHVMGCFRPHAAEKLKRAVEGLRQRGTGFDLPQLHGPLLHEPLETTSGQRFRVMGSRASQAGDPPVDFVWFREISGEEREKDSQSTLVDALSEDKARLERILDALPIPVWWRNNDLSLRYCNRAYRRAVDAESDPDAAITREIAAGLVSTQGRALGERAILTRMAQSESHHLVVDGMRHLLEFTEVPLGSEKEGHEQEDGGPQGVVGFALDFSEMEVAHQELNRHIAAHGEVLERINIAIAIFSPEQKLTFFNIAFARLWGLDVSWLESQPQIGEIHEILYEKRLLPEYADFQAFKKKQRELFTSLIEPREEMVHLPDTTTLRTLVAPHPFGGLIFTYEDVTDRLALESSYNTLIDVQRETLDNLYEGIAVFGNDGRLKLSNPAYARIWNLDADTLAAEPHIRDIAEKTRKFWPRAENWEQIREEMVSPVTTPIPATGQFRRNDDSIIDYGCVPLPDGNVLLTYIDISDRFRVEQALRGHANAMEEAARLKSEFLANVSYELRTPLNTIIGFSEILANQYFGELSPRQMEYSKGILDSSQHLLMLINDILDLATIEAGYMQLELENVNVQTMLSGAMSLLQEQAASRELTFSLECGQDVGEIYADARRIKQAVFNLLSNSAKFTLPGGEVRLSARRADKELHITVTDTGIGLSEVEQEKAFDTFIRGKRHASYRGPGLGLPLVKNLVELHGGQVIMTSQMDKGTCVEIILPVRSELVEAGRNGGVEEAVESGEAGDGEAAPDKTGDDGEGGEDVKSAGQA